MIKTKPATLVREKILKAAVKLLGESGIKKLAQPQIAKKAGVPQGHMTYYFPTRSDLLMEVAERSLRSIGELVLKKASQYQSLTTQDSLSLVIPLIQDKSRTRMMIGLLVESDENPKLKAKLREQLDFSRSLIGIALNREADSPEVSSVHASLIGLGIQYYLQTDGIDAGHLQTVVRNLVEKYGEAK